MVQWVQIRSKEDREWHLIYELYYVQKQKGNKSLPEIYENFAVLVRTTLGLFGTGTEAWQFRIQAVCVCVSQKCHQNLRLHASKQRSILYLLHNDWSNHPCLYYCSQTLFMMVFIARSCNVWTAFLLAKLNSTIILIGLLLKRSWSSSYGPWS